MPHDYTPIYEGDRYCLMCRHACPVERVTRREATSPHGWALLVASVNRGQLRWDPEEVDTLYQCADCGLCQANCATDRPLPAAIVAARADVANMGLMPGSVKALNESLRMWGNPYGAPSHNGMSRFAWPGEEGTTGEAIGLFVGAATLHKRPETVQAALTILREGGVEAALLSTGRSGIYLPYTVGLWDTARDIAGQTLREIDEAGVGRILTLSREDAHAFRSLYAELEISLPEGLQVMEFIEWLGEMLDTGALKIKPLEMGAVTYHDPCHTTRVRENIATGRRIVEMLTGAPPREMLWRGKAAAPCGSVGGFEFTQPWLADALADRRLSEAESTGAEVLVTEDPQCAAHLQARSTNLSVANLIELVADQLESAYR